MVELNEKAKSRASASHTAFLPAAFLLSVKWLSELKCLANPIAGVVGQG